MTKTKNQKNLNKKRQKRKYAIGQVSGSVCRVTLIRCDISCFNYRDDDGETNCRMELSHQLVWSSFVSYLRVNFIWVTVEGFLLNTNKKEKIHILYICLIDHVYLWNYKNFETTRGNLTKGLLFIQFKVPLNLKLFFTIFKLEKQMFNLFILFNSPKHSNSSDKCWKKQWKQLKAKNLCT